MKNTEKPTKPLALAMEEAEKETIAAVNSIMAKYDLPCYFYEIIFDKVHRKLKDGSEGELHSVSAQYEAELVEHNAKQKAEAKDSEEVK